MLDEEGEEVLSRRVEATEEDLEASCSELERLGGEHTVRIDLLGGPATILEVVLLVAGAGVYVLGYVVIVGIEPGQRRRS